MQIFFARWPSGRKVKWRSLTWAEFKKFDRQLDYDCPASVYCDVYRAVLLDGPPLDGDPVYQAPAGLVEWIARALLDSNPFNGEYKDVKRALDMKRVELKSSWLNSAKSIIAGIFRYTFEEIESWDAEMFFERLAYAEFVCGRKLEPGDPDKPDAQHPGKKTGHPEGPPKPAKRELSPAQQKVVNRVINSRK
jgi:hypothetical protein